MESLPIKAFLLLALLPALFLASLVTPVSGAAATEAPIKDDSAKWLTAARNQRQKADLDRAYQIHLHKLQLDSVPPLLQPEVQDERIKLHEALFQAGVKAYHDADYELARRQFARSLVMNPQAKSQVGIMLGLTYQGMGKFSLARQRFHDATQSALDKNQLIVAQELFRLEDERESRSKSVWLTAELSAGFISNTFPIDRKVGVEERPVGSAGFTFGYPWLQEENWRVRSSFSFSNEQSFWFPNESTLRNSLQNFIGYSAGTWNYFVTPIASYDLRAGLPYSLRAGSGAGIEKYLDSNTLGFLFQRTQIFAQRYSYLSGPLDLAKIYWSYSGKTWLIMLAAQDRRDGMSDLDLEPGILPLTGRYDGPAISFSSWAIPALEIDVNASYLWGTFDHVAQPSLVERKDQQLNLNARLSYIFKPQLKAFLSIDFTQNRSTLTNDGFTNNNYTQLIVFTGASWAILQ